MVIADNDVVSKADLRNFCLSAYARDPEDFTAIAQARPSCHAPHSRLQMGLVHKEDRNYTAARELFERARAIDPASPSIHHYITAVYASCAVFVLFPTLISAGWASTTRRWRQ